MCRYRFSVLMLVLLFSVEVFAQDKNAREDKKKLSEVSIIGNTELPNINFDLPWKLPTVSKRDEQTPLSELDGMLSPIEPKTHRDRLFFNQHLKMDLPKY